MPLDRRVPLRVGVIGLGVGERHALAVASHDGAELVLVCDSDVDRLEAVGERFPGVRRESDWERVVDADDVDVVIIATFDRDHGRQLLAALGHGKHVFVEKPLCTRPDELRSIRAAIRERPGQLISSNLVLRREPRFIRLRDRLRSGVLGHPYLFEGSYDYGRLEKLTSGWRGRDPGYSVMHGGGIHLLDLILWLKGDAAVEEVVAYGSGLATRGTAFHGRDLAVALLRFVDGALARVSANFASVTPHHHLVSVYGTSGTFLQSHAGAEYRWSRDSSDSSCAPEAGRVGAPEPDLHAYPSARKGELLGAFLDRILGGGEGSVTEQEILATTTVAMAIEASIERGAPVRTEEYAT